MKLQTSPSTLNFDRTVYDSPEVQNLITELGVDEALAIIGQLPWENLSKDGTEVILSSGAPSSLEINGLTISAEELATISAISPGYFGLSGISISANGNGFDVDAIELSSPGTLDLLGATQGVIGIPLDFFTAIPSDDITAPENLTELIEGVLFSDNFDFRELATIELTPENISNIAAGIDPILPDDEIVPRCEQHWHLATPLLRVVSRTMVC